LIPVVNLKLLLLTSWRLEAVNNSPPISLVGRTIYLWTPEHVRGWQKITGLKFTWIYLGSSVADLWCLSRILDPYFFHPGSRTKKIPDLHQRVLVCFTPKKIVSKLSEIWSGMFILDPDLHPSQIPDPGVKKGTGSQIRIRNTARKD
jgi:hypothetical protein